MLKDLADRRVAFEKLMLARYTKWEDVKRVRFSGELHIGSGL